MQMSWGLEGVPREVRLSLSYQPLPHGVSCLHSCSSVLQRGHFGEDARKRSARSWPACGCLVLIVWKHLLSRCACNFFQAEMTIFLLSGVEFWSFCVISHSKLFSKSWLSFLVSLPANFSSLRPLPSHIPSTDTY